MVPDPRGQLFGDVFHSATTRRALLAGSAIGLIGVAAAAVRRSITRISPAQNGIVVVDAGGAAAPAPYTAQSVQNAASFDALVARQARMLNGGALFAPGAAPYAALTIALDQQVADYLAILNEAAGRTYLWNDAASSTGSANMTHSFNRVRLMAIQYTTAGSTYAGSATLLAKMQSALQWLSANRYYAGAAKSGNWWDWEIGTPLALLDTLVLLRASLDPALVSALLEAARSLAGSVKGTAANRAWSARVVLLRSILANDVTAFNAAQAAVIGLASTVTTSGDGFYADGSFVQHDIHAYTGGYGIDMIFQCAWLIYLLAGSPDTALASANWAKLREWAFTAFEPFLFRGSLSGSVMGRGISRVFLTDHSTGAAFTCAAILMAEVADAADALPLRSLVKATLTQNTAFDFFAYSPVTGLGKLTIDLARMGWAIRGNTAIAIRPEDNATHIFPAMDRVAHRRPGFAVTLAMYSTRIANYESINGENLKGWNTGSGMMYFLNAAKLDHYSDDYWPTVDPMRLPGTTLDRAPRSNGQGQSVKGSANMVGGVANLTCGVACMALGSDASYIRARKSWLIVSDFIVCMGSGIDCTSSYGVETIIDNRNLGAAGGNAVRMNSTGATILAAREQQQTLAASWISIDDVGGYVFLGSNPPIRGLRTLRTGTWRAINSATTAPTDPRSREYATLWFDHGVAPVDAGYSYVFMPNATASQTASFAQNPKVALTRTLDVHHAQSTFSNLVVHSAMFWAAGSAGVLSASAPVAICVRVGGGQVIIAVSDPSQAQTAPITIEVRVPNSGLATQDSGLSVTASATSATIRFDPTASKGATRRAVLNG